MYHLSGNFSIKPLLLFLVGIMWCGFSHAQDIHFSQFFNNPMAVNPSLAGEDADRGRFIINYKSQWNGITDNPYNTCAMSFDRSIIGDELSGAIQIFHDKAGDSRMGTTQVNIAIAPKLWISQSDFLKAGIMGAWSQRFVNSSALTWNSQFDGTSIDPNLNSGEDIYQEHVNYFDCTAGLLWSHQFTRFNSVRAGVSAYHASRPKFRFGSATENLNIRWVGHADASWILVPSKISIHPSGIFMAQGAARELEFGAITKISIGLNSKYTGYYKASQVSFGVFYRNKDAIILYGGFEYRNQLQINLSYDINVSKYIASATSRGGMEISVIYTIPKKNIIKLR